MQAWLDNITIKLGEKNPQIFRELKGRLTVRNTIAAILISLAVQGFLLLNFLGELPQKVSENNRTNIRDIDPTRVYNRFCELHKVTIGNPPYPQQFCKLDAAGNFIIKWPIWWESVLGTICWILPMALILGCVYLLVADLAREEKRGTLNFIRLSPQNPWKIFTGKIIGAPFLLYLGIACAIPLFFSAGIQSGASISTLLLWLGTIAGMTWLFTSATILYALLGGVQAILTTFATGYLLFVPLLVVNSVFSSWNDSSSWNSSPLYWYLLPIESHIALIYGFGLLCCGLATYWAWRAIERRYLNPLSTVLSKVSTYWVTGCIQFVLWGFSLPIVFNLYGKTGYRLEQMTRDGLGMSIAVNWIWALALILITLPQRQPLIDWSRYRRERDLNNWLSRDLWKDLLTNDKSPAIVAVIVNGLAILAANLPLAFVAILQDSYQYRSLVGGAISLTLLTIYTTYTTIFHLGLFIKWKRRNIISVAIVGSGVFIPIVLFTIFGYGSTFKGAVGNLLLFSPFMWAKITEVTGRDLSVIFVLQAILAVVLVTIFTRRLNRLGESMMRAAMRTRNG